MNVPRLLAMLMPVSATVSLTPTMPIMAETITRIQIPVVGVWYFGFIRPMISGISLSFDMA